jgi:hypothetical protein
MSSLQEWINAALLVADAEGMANEEIMPSAHSPLMDKVYELVGEGGGDAAD